MRTKTFTRKLEKIIESTNEFVTNTIDLTDMKKDAKKKGFDDLIFVAGEDEDEVFMLHVQKINP